MYVNTKKPICTVFRVLKWNSTGNTCKRSKPHYTVLRHSIPIRHQEFHVFKQWKQALWKLLWKCWKYRYIVFLHFLRLETAVLNSFTCLHVKTLRNCLKTRKNMISVFIKQDEKAIMNCFTCFKVRKYIKTPQKP